MGRRKWKLYQEVLVRSHSNSNTTLTTANQINNITETGNYFHNFSNFNTICPNEIATKKNLTNTVLQNKSFLIDVHCNNGEGISSTHQQNTQNSAEIDNVSVSQHQQQQQLQQQKERELQSKLIASNFGWTNFNNAPSRTAEQHAHFSHRTSIGQKLKCAKIASSFAHIIKTSIETFFACKK